MEFIDVVTKRESTRKFSDEIVSDEVLNKILEVGRIAPSAKNYQPTRIIVVKSSEGLSKIDECSRCRFNAPVVLIICGDKNIAWREGDYSSYEMDGSIVGTHIMLAATNYGVDNIWIKLFDKELTKELFGLEENIQPICLMPLGYRKEEYKGSPLHNLRKNLDEIVTYM